MRYGIKSVTMDDLARELAVSKKTLYLHFKDKKEVVQRVVRHLIQLQEEGIREAVSQPDTNAIDKLMLMTRFFARMLRNSNPSLTYDLQKHFPEAWEEIIAFKYEQVFQHILNNIALGIQEGLYRDDPNYDIIALAYISRMEMYLTDLWQPLEKYPLEEVLNVLFIYHTRGIAGPRGLEYLEANKEKWNFH